MVTRLENAELQQFLEAEVRNGHYVSIDAAIEDAVAQMKYEMEHLPPLDADLEERLTRSDEQIARGEYYTTDQVRAMFAAKASSKA